MSRPLQKFSRARDGDWREVTTRLFPSGNDPVVTTGKSQETYVSMDRAASKTSPKGPDGWRKPASYALERVNNRGHSAGYSVRRIITPTTVTQVIRSGLPSWNISVPGETFPVHLRNVAERECLIKLKDQKVDFSVMAGEVRSTARMFADNTTRLAGAVRAVRRGDLSDALKHLGVKAGTRKVHQRWNAKSPSQRWLELQYGVLPLVNDVVGSAELLAEQALDPLSGLINVRARETQWSRNRTSVLQPSGFELVTKDEVRHEAYVRLSYLPDPAFSAYLARWGLSNPAATAYELMPYSLVLDWALPVGQWLQALDADMGYAFKGGSCSYTTLSRRSMWELPSTRINGKQLILGQESSMSRAGERWKFWRTAYGSSPGPWFPSWREMTLPSLKQAANGLAMLAQSFIK